MGERVAPAPQIRSRRPGAAAFVLAAVLLLLAVLSVVPGAELDRDQVTAVLAARSVLQDRDLRYATADRDRLQQWTDRLGGDREVPMPRTVGADEAPRYGLPATYAVTLAPVVALGGARAAAGLQGLLLAAALGFAGWRLQRRLGPDTWWLGSLLVVATPFFTLVPRLWPETLAAAAVVTAFALSLGGGHGQEALGEIYGGLEERRARTVAGWLGVGILLGIGVALSPPLVGLLLPLALTARERRAPGTVTVLLVSALVIGGAAVVVDAELLPAAASSAPISGPEVSSAADDTTVEVLFETTRWDWRLWLWNLVYLGVGRFVGVVFYVAVLAVLVTASVGSRSRRLWLGAALGVVVLLTLHPFDAFGGSSVFGPRSLLPFVPALWFVAERRPPRWALVATLVWAGVFLWPLWIRPLTAPVDEGRLHYAAPYLSPWIPVETTAPALPHGPRLDVDELRVTVLTTDTEALGGGRIRLGAGDRTVELLVAAPGAIETLRLETDGDAGVEVEVGGAELARSIFRPDGGVGFELDLGEASTRHPLPGSRDDWHFHRVWLRFPGAPPTPTVVRLVR